MTQTLTTQIQQIITKLTYLGSPPVAIAHRERTQDDWRSDDPVYDFWIIVKNEENIKCDDDKLEEWYGWENQQDLQILLFDESGCVNGVDALLKEFEETDGAKEVWRG